MEFERSLFRVYEKIVSSVGQRSPSERGGRVPAQQWSFVQWAMRVCILVSVLSLPALIALHWSFVGDGSCLRGSLELQHLEPRIYDLAVFSNLTGDRTKLLSDSIIRIWAYDDEELLSRADEGTDPLSSHVVLESPAFYGYNEWAEDKGIVSERAKPHYEFSADPAFLLIDEALRPAHNVYEWNLTFSRECYGLWFRYGILNKLLMMNMDDVIVNQLMYGLEESEGVLRNLETHESWSWRNDRLSKRESSTIQRIIMNLIVLWRVLVLFAFVSSMTALMVRTLISSGVALMFPIVSLLRKYNLVPHEVVRLLTLSYPWIGGDVEVLTSAGQSAGPLIRAHLFNVVVTYAAYEACQFAWRRFLLGFKPQPVGLEVFIFAFVMVCEYYLLIFARAPRTLRYLPRLIALSLILYLVYSFAVPYGFTSAAGVLLWSWTLFWMFWFVDKCEVKALRRGIVSVEAPRAFYTLLASPQWPMSLPPHWSTFHELNRVQRSVYEQDYSAPEEPDIEQGPDDRSQSEDLQQIRHSAEVAAGPALPDTRLAHRRGRRENPLPLVMNPPAMLNPPGPNGLQSGDSGTAERSVEEE